MKSNIEKFIKETIKKEFVVGYLDCVVNKGIFNRPCKEMDLIYFGSKLVNKCYLCSMRINDCCMNDISLRQGLK